MEVGRWLAPHQGLSAFFEAVTVDFIDQLYFWYNTVMKKAIDYEEFKKALEILDMITLTSYADLKERYLKLSKQYHPDMAEGDAEKFKEINEAYKIIQKYMQEFRFQLNEEEFYQQNPFSKKPGDWFYNF